MAVAGCGNNVGQARLTLVNANPHRITVHVPTGDGTAAFSVGGCETVDFTWDQGWRAVSGVSAPDAREPQVFIYSGGPANDQALPQYLDIVTGTSYLEYRATDRPSMPVCDSPSDLAPSSG